MPKPQWTVKAKLPQYIPLLLEAGILFKNTTEMKILNYEQASCSISHQFDPGPFLLTSIVVKSILIFVFLLSVFRLVPDILFPYLLNINVHLLSIHSVN